MCCVDLLQYFHEEDLLLSRFEEGADQAPTPTGSEQAAGEGVEIGAVGAGAAAAEQVEVTVTDSIATSAPVDTMQR